MTQLKNIGFQDEIPLDNEVVHNTGNETIAGEKTFTSRIKSPIARVEAAQFTNDTDVQKWHLSQFGDGVNNDLSLAESGVADYRIYFKKGGNVGIGTNNPTERLEVNGNIKANNLTNLDNTSDLNKPISTATQTALDNKVDKIVGKGLSQEDYTTTEKSKLAGIESGAEVNNISDVNATDLTDGGDTNLHTHDGRYYTESETDTLLLAKANDNEVVKLTGDQSIEGNKNFATNTLYVDDTNDRVGVGTITPSEKLDVTGNIQASGAIRTPNLVLTGDRIERHDADSDAVGPAVNYRGFSGGTTRFRNFTIFDGKGTEITRFVGATGNVGIGQTNPGAKLEVKSGAVNSYVFRATSSDGQILASIFEESDTRPSFSLNNASAVQTVRFDTNGNSYINGGNVGIGETSPDYKLDVNGAIGFTPGIGTTITPVDNGDIVFQASSNTSLVIKMKGSDGVIRSTTLTLS